MRKISIGVTTEQLRRAISIREQIDLLEQELMVLLGGQRRGPGRPAARRASSATARRGRKRGQRNMSAAGRRRISEAAKARWARFRDKQK